MGRYNDTGIWEFDAGEWCLITAEVVKQIDPETVRMKFYTPEGETEVDLSASTVMGVYPPIEPTPLTFKKIQGFKEEG